MDCARAGDSYALSADSVCVRVEVCFDVSFRMKIYLYPVCYPVRWTCSGCLRLRKVIFSAFLHDACALVPDVRA